MSREKKPGIFWGTILKEMRKAAGLNQADIAKAIYEGDPKYTKGNISLIERNIIPITEDKIRLWVQTCGKNMTEFYIRANAPEMQGTPLEASKPHKKSL